MSCTTTDGLEYAYTIIYCLCAVNQGAGFGPSSALGTIGWGTGMGVSQTGMGVGQTGMGVGHTGMGVSQTGMGVSQTGMGVGQTGMGVGHTGMGAGQTGMGAGSNAPTLGGTKFGSAAVFSGTHNQEYTT